MKLENKEIDFLESLLIPELKRVKHYSPMKSKMIIDIAIKFECSNIDEMKAIYKQFYNCDY